MSFPAVPGRSTPVSLLQLTSTQVSELGAHGSGDEACLVVSLTFKVAPDRLPSVALRPMARSRLVPLEVTARDASDLRHGIFSHASDIDPLRFGD